MGARAAIVSIGAFSVTCPVCEDEQVHPATGSLMWTPEEIANDWRDGKLQCANCGAAIKIPKKYCKA